jgi:DNA polymerase-3 subunit beta
MQLIVTQENLSKALNAVGRVATSKTPLPILNNILIRTDKNRLLVAATNLEAAITRHIGAKVTSEGAITIPARLFMEFISNLPKANVELKVEGTHLHIKSGAYSSTINGAIADEFPELPTINDKQAVKLDIATSDLKQAVSQTIITASSDTTRPVLTGAYIHTFENKLFIAATDGYRLAERQLGKQADQLEAIVPTSTLQDVLRVAPDECETIKILFDETQVRFRVDDIEITSRLIEGKFPDYRQLIPKKSEINASLEKSEFIRITKIASLFARESAGSIALKTNKDQKTLSIHSIASQLGENTSEASADINADGQVTLNSRYLLEALNSIDSENVKFSFSGKLSPCVLTADDKTVNYQHIIMPLKS